MEDIIAYIIIVFGVIGVFKFVRSVLKQGFRILRGRPLDQLSETRIYETRSPTVNGYVSVRTVEGPIDSNIVIAHDEYEIEYQEKRKVMGDTAAHDFVNLRKWEDEMVADYYGFLSENENAISGMFYDLLKTLGLIRGLIERSDGDDLFLDDLFNHLLPLLDKLFNNYVFFSQQDPHLIRGVTRGRNKAEEGIGDAMSLLRKKAQYLVDMEVVDMTTDISSLELSHADKLARKYEK